MAASDDDKDDKATDADDSAEEAEAGASGEGEGEAEEQREEETAPGKREAILAKQQKSPDGKSTSAAPKAAPKANPVPPPSAGLGKSVSLFVAIVGGISVLMLLLGNERGVSGPAAPQWKEGDTVDVDITLVSTDKQDLACASGSDLKGLHCGFESQGKRWTKTDATDEKTTLRPYSTVNGVNFLAAGVWSDPALTADLPKTRFAVTCKFKVAGKFGRADVRWHEGEGWNNTDGWFTGDVSACKISSIQK
ncbi:MAG: hypothetical protein U0441_34360 [Polyangiaceae bacterium]